MFSTFLNAAVALLTTVGAINFGFFTDKIAELASGEFLGGGPVESLYRLVMQKNLTAPLEEGGARSFVETCDLLIRPVFHTVGSLVPDFVRFSDVDYVAAGFDIPGDQVLTQVVGALAYALPVFVVGFVLLKFREVAR